MTMMMMMSSKSFVAVVMVALCFLVTQSFAQEIPTSARVNLNDMQQRILNEQTRRIQEGGSSHQATKGEGGSSSSGGEQRDKTYDDLNEEEKIRVKDAIKRMMGTGFGGMNWAQGGGSSDNQAKPDNDEL